MTLFGRCSSYFFVVLHRRIF